jgi:hypothetical protein
MIGEHYPSGWNDKQVSIDFIGGTSSLTGKVIDSTATGCVVELAPGEVVEAELDRLIERCSRQNDPDLESELWKESVRAYEEKRRQVARLEWHAFHCGQAARHRAVLESLMF